MAEKRSLPAPNSSAHQPQRPSKKQRTNTSHPAPQSGPIKVVQFTPAELDAGLLPLLDHLIDLEAATTHTNTPILQSARTLRTLLHERASQSLPSNSKITLDRTRPARGTPVPIPPYLHSQIKASANLPPLPELSEAHLQNAVFRHRSTLTPSTDLSDPSAETYERLEFLGDAYIEIISTRLIYSHFPTISVGQQAQIREILVKNEKLAEFAHAYGFGARVMHAGHEHLDRGWTKILADVFEAYVAAIILSDDEKGFATAEQWLTELWSPLLVSYNPRPIANPQAKNDIARLVGAKGIRVDYREERPMEFTNGIQKYFIGCYLTGWGYRKQWLGSGEGQNKAEAGMMAAMDALERSKDVLEKAAKSKREVFPNTKGLDGVGGLSKNEDHEKINQGDAPGSEGVEVDLKESKKRKQKEVELEGEQNCAEKQRENGTHPLEKDKKKKKKKRRGSGETS